MVFEPEKMLVYQDVLNLTHKRMLGCFPTFCERKRIYFYVVPFLNLTSECSVYWSAKSSGMYGRIYIIYTDYSKPMVKETMEINIGIMMI